MTVVDGYLRAAWQAQRNDPFAPIVGNRPARRLTGPLKVVAFNAQGCETRRRSLRVSSSRRWRTRP